MELPLAQAEFKKLINTLEADKQSVFLSWIIKQFCPKVSDSNETEKYHALRTIAADIRSMVPVDAILPSESIMVPKKEYNDVPTMHVDAFLYEDDDVDQLVEQGKLSRNICKDCHSLNVVPLHFISHSASIMQIEFTFKYFTGDLLNKVFLDVGSRLGPFLYGAYYFANCAKIIGVEMNKDWCMLQQAMCDKYGMNDRIKIICDDVRNIPLVVQSADVIVLHNAFECFQNGDEQMRIWNFLRHNTKSQVLLVTVPSLEETLKKLEYKADLTNWVREIFVADPVALLEMEEHEELNDIHAYVVI